MQTIPYSCSSNSKDFYTTFPQQYGGQMYPMGSPYFAGVRRQRGTKSFSKKISTLSKNQVSEFIW
jgi:hypothetical protein